MGGEQRAASAPSRGWQRANTEESFHCSHSSTLVSTMFFFRFSSLLRSPLRHFLGPSSIFALMLSIFTPLPLLGLLYLLLICVFVACSQNCFLSVFPNIENNLTSPSERVVRSASRNMGCVDAYGCTWLHMQASAHVYAYV